MKITYDAEVDALYIQFLETKVTTEHLAGGIAADYDAEGRLAEGRAVMLTDQYAPVEQMLGPVFLDWVPK